jgi:hypothetical protein
MFFNKRICQTAEKGIPAGTTGEEAGRGGFHRLFPAAKQQK